MRLFVICALCAIALTSTNVLAGGSANMIFVNTIEDVAIDGDMVDLGSGEVEKISLREALAEANTNNVEDVINFDTGIFDDATSGRQTIVLDSALGDLPQFTKTEKLTIMGPSTNQVLIDADDASRIFTFAAGTNVVLTDLVLTNGNSATSDIGRGDGGAIYNQGSLTIWDSTITGNEATNTSSTGGGGGIYNNAGSVTLGDGTAARRVFISLNNASGTSGSGGGIFNNAGSLEINGGSLSSNRAARAGGAIESLGAATTTLTGVSVDRNNTTTGSGVTANPGNGGGIHVSGGGTVNIFRSSVTRNSAANEGGGLWSSNTGMMNIISSTISSNSARTGGGIFADQGELLGNPPAGSCSNTALSLIHVTVASNSASDASSSGGLFAENACDPVAVNSIFGNNQAASVNSDVKALQARIDNSLIEAGVITTNTGTNIAGDANLAALSTLGDTGTQIHRLNPASATTDDDDTEPNESIDSPALDNLDFAAVTACSDAANVDQREAVRDFDFDQVGGNNCDLGAFEIRTNVFAELTNPEGFNGLLRDLFGGTYPNAYTAPKDDAILLGFKIRATALSNGATPGQTVRMTTLAGRILEGNLSLLNYASDLRVYRVTDSNSNPETSSDPKLIGYGLRNSSIAASPIVTYADPRDIDVDNDGNFKIDLTTVADKSLIEFNSSDAEPAFYILTVDINPTLSAAMFGLPLIALAFLQRRKSVRLLIMGFAFLTMLSACSSDSVDPDDPIANSTENATFRILLNSITVLDPITGATQEILQVSPTPNITSRTLFRAFPK